MVESKKSVFVAYSYALYPKKDYRKIFSAIENQYNVSFIFADEKITNMHIMQKIVSYIKSSEFSIFDISGWNPNVTLELGFAMALGDNWYICFNPKHTQTNEVPSDIRGIDRIQYESFDDLERNLTILIDHKFGKARPPLDEYIASMKKRALDVIDSNPGLNIKEIAQLMGLETKVAQVIIQPLVGIDVRTEGKTKATKYFIQKYDGVIIDARYIEQA